MIRCEGPWFKDEYGRTLLLRGVNLGGSSKVPSEPDGATYLKDGFFDHRRVSFVGRPFPLAEADEHFRRLKRWGFTFLRMLTTWEAIEHAGPGEYDLDYLDYLTAVVRKAGEHGLSLFIDPHQDVWSRFSGGDGAPGWTFEVVGLDITRFSETGAAIVHQVHGDPYPRMIWPTNAEKLASATMFSLFFGGTDFAPHTLVDGEPIQEYLQRHYLAAIGRVAERLAGLPHVLGYDTLNEPSPGYIGVPHLGRPIGTLRLGISPTPFQSMLLASGIPQQVDRWRMGFAGARRAGSELVNASGSRAWLAGRECVWRENGVWDLDARGEPRLLRAEHFSQRGGRKVDFAADYYKPFAVRFARAMQAIHPQALTFIETEPGYPAPPWGPEDPQDVVFAPHWYDGLTLFLKAYTPHLGIDFRTTQLIFGAGGIRRSFAKQLGALRLSGSRVLHAPTLLGEFGIPFDMHEKRAFRSGDFSRQAAALDRSFRALEANLLSGTLWNYTADNTNAHGDLWNDEDFSVFSRDQQRDPASLDSGGRALEAAVRPYPRAVAGEPLRTDFDYRRGTFLFEFRHDPKISQPTEIFVPELQYPGGFEAHLSDGSLEPALDPQVVLYHHTPGEAVHAVRLVRK